VNTHTQAEELVSLTEYLSIADYDPDMEYVDGRLVNIYEDKPSSHGFLQGLISSWFIQHEEWGLIVGPGIRTQVSPTRVRLPDVVVLKQTGDYPPALIDPPLIVIEILSASDRHSEVLQKGREYAAMGIPNIWLIDPETRILQQWQNNAWQLLDGNEFHIAESPVYLDMAPLFARLARLKGF
jgi:Uma2 family endonuclease